MRLFPHLSLISLYAASPPLEPEQPLGDGAGAALRPVDNVILHEGKQAVEVRWVSGHPVGQPLRACTETQAIITRSLIVAQAVAAVGVRRGAGLGLHKRLAAEQRVG